MDSKNRHIDFELLARYLSGEAAGEEKYAFEQWLKEKPENAELFREYSNLWKQMDKVGPVAGIDLETEWRKLETAINKLDAIPVARIHSGRKIKSLAVRITVAAVFVLILSLGGIFITRFTGYTSILTDNNTKNVILPDGSRVTLNHYSSLEYKKRFRRDMRKVVLEGEAFFEITRDENRPFLIGTEGVEIRVLGTSFNVNAYKKNSEIEVIVSTGEVALTKSGETPQTIILKPGSKGVFSRSDQSLRISGEIDRNYLAWKTRNFVFEDQPLIEVVRILNRVYGKEIIIASDSLKDARITTTFNDLTLEAILNVLSATLNLNAEEINGRILLTEES